jgi:hypothetical protein
MAMLITCDLGQQDGPTGQRHLFSLHHITEQLFGFSSLKML